MYDPQADWDYVNQLGSQYGFNPSDFRVNEARPTYGGANWEAQVNNFDSPAAKQSVAQPTSYIPPAQSTYQAPQQTQSGSNPWTTTGGWKPPAANMSNPSFGYTTPPEGYGTPYNPFQGTEQQPGTWQDQSAWGSNTTTPSYGQTPGTSTGGSTQPWQNPNSQYVPGTIGGYDHRAGYNPSVAGQNYRTVDPNAGGDIITNFRNKLAQAAGLENYTAPAWKATDATKYKNYGFDPSGAQSQAAWRDTLALKKAQRYLAGDAQTQKNVLERLSSRGSDLYRILGLQDPNRPQ